MCEFLNYCMFFIMIVSSFSRMIFQLVFDGREVQLCIVLF